MTVDQQLAHAIRMQFKTSSEEPNDEQLRRIKETLLKMRNTGSTPTGDDWRKTVALYCPSAGTHKYAGLDNSDLNTLLALATQSAR